MFPKIHMTTIFPSSITMFTKLIIYNYQAVKHKKVDIKCHSSRIFFSPLSFTIVVDFSFPLSIFRTCSLKPCRVLSATVPWPFCMSKSGGVVRNVIPPIYGGPQEHTGPPPRIGGGLAGFPVKSRIIFYLLVGSLPLLTFSFNLPPALNLVTNPRVVLFLLPNICSIGIHSVP